MPRRRKRRRNQARCFNGKGLTCCFSNCPRNFPQNSFRLRVFHLHNPKQQQHSSHQGQLVSNTGDLYIYAAIKFIHFLENAATAATTTTDANPKQITNSSESAPNSNQNVDTNQDVKPDISLIKVKVEKGDGAENSAPQMKPPPEKRQKL